MIKTILVPTDGSEHAKKAVLLASDIAAKYQAGIVLLHVMLDGATAAELRNLVNVKWLPKSALEAMNRTEEIQRAAATMPEAVSVAIPLPDEALEAVGKAILDDADATARKHGVKSIKRLLKRGRPAQCILAGADDEKVNMIIMGSRGLGDLRGMLVGSVSHKVGSLANCTCVTVK
jgi:nucleotide-binding universal stress UspA family protein